MNQAKPERAGAPARGPPARFGLAIGWHVAVCNRATTAVPRPKLTGCPRSPIQPQCGRGPSVSQRAILAIAPSFNFYGRTMQPNRNESEG